MVLGWGKKMQKTPKDDEDMSMEEILASIRKYVTDDHSQQKTQEPASWGGADPSSETIGAPEAQANEDHIVELTDPMPQDGGGTTQAQVMDSAQTADTQGASGPSVSYGQSQGSSGALHQTEPSQSYAAQGGQGDPTPSSQTADPVRTSKSTSSDKASSLMSQSADLKGTPSSGTSSPSTFKGNSMTHVHSVPTTQEEGLASKETVSSSTQALSRLVQAVAPTPQSSSSDQSAAPQTLDALIGNLARPLVKQWIDQNLSQLVESMVSREIEKITKNLR